MSDGQCPSSVQPPPRQERDALLMEYQCAQHSAHHYDNLGWQAINVFWVAMGILIYVGFQHLSSEKLEWHVTVLAILAISMAGFIWIASRLLRSLKLQAYKKCDCLASLLCTSAYRHVDYPEGAQSKLLGFVIIIVAVLWSLVLRSLWGSCWGILVSTFCILVWVLLWLYFEYCRSKG